MEIAIILALCLNALMSTVVVVSVFPTLARMKKSGEISGFIKSYGMFSVAFQASVAILALMTIWDKVQDLIIGGVQLPYILLGMMAVAWAFLFLWVVLFHSKRW